VIVKPFRHVSVRKPKIFVRASKDVTLTFPTMSSYAFPDIIRKNSLEEARYSARAKEIASHCQAVNTTYSGFFVSPDMAIVHEKNPNVDEVMKFSWIGGVLLIKHEPYKHRKGNKHAPSSHR